MAACRIRRYSATLTLTPALLVNCLTATLIIVNRYSNMPTWGTLVFIGIVAAFFLFLEDKIAELILKWGSGGGSAKLKGK
jgi:hypothetical protein